MKKESFKSNEQLEKTDIETLAELRKANELLKEEIATLEVAKDRAVSHNISLEQAIHAQSHKLLLLMEQADSAGVEKSRFLANMSHELRTPMHGILGFSEIALNKISNHDHTMCAHYFQHIGEVGERLTLLFNDLLDLAKLEAGKVKLNLVGNDLSGLIIRCVDEVRSLCDMKRLTIQMDRDKHVSGVFDKKLIGQVVTNLLSNAIKFSHEAGIIKIEIDDNLQEINGIEQRVLSFVVKDQGVGIPEDELKTVFDKFIQSSKTITQAGGTGLGLPICKEIIHSHKGRIWAISPLKDEMMQSESGEITGTELHVVIPARQ